MGKRKRRRAKGPGRMPGQRQAAGRELCPTVSARLRYMGLWHRQNSMLRRRRRVVLLNRCVLFLQHC